MKRYRLLVSGRVQGVGFRWYVKDLARQNALCGWVRNLRNGQVEVVAEGDERAWQSFLDQLRSGHLGRNIEKLEVAEEVSGEALEGFEIRFS